MSAVSRTRRQLDVVDGDVEKKGRSGCAFFLPSPLPQCLQCLLSAILATLQFTRHLIPGHSPFSTTDHIAGCSEKVEIFCRVQITCLHDFLPWPWFCSRLSR